MSTPKNEKQYIDSCTFSIEIAKQFITIATAGIAFLVGMALKFQCSMDNLWIYAIIGLFLSVTSGLLYLMNVVGHVNNSGNYDVYTKSLRFLSGSQIILFVFSLFLVSLITFKSVSSNIKKNKTLSNKTINYNVFIEDNTRKVKLYLPSDKVAKVKSMGEEIIVSITSESKKANN